MSNVRTSDVGIRIAPDWASAAMNKRVSNRYRANGFFKFYGLAAILTALGLLALLLGSIGYTSYTAFTQTKLALEVYVDPAKLDREDLFRGDYRAMVRASLLEKFPEVTERADQKKLYEIPSTGAQLILRDKVAANPNIIGQRVQIVVPLSDPFDQLNKGTIKRETPESDRRVTDQQIAWFDTLAAAGALSRPFNWALIFSADSRYPELAGLKGAIIGSFYALFICLALSFPIGVAAAVYLEEFAPKNRWTDLIEVNINNLAAVPSVVFGLLGLALFLGAFGLPRSSPLVGGMVLALMSLPTIIIAARAALKQVPPSIREAALGIGASKHQTVTHHVLPLAMPGILTGTIIAMAQALGETAPLLLIGMNAFLTEAPAGIVSPSTALPTQIFLWADSPERGFLARTAAGIIVLLMFLVLMNAVAIVLRQRFQRRW